MDIHARLDPAELFSAKGLVVVITGGGSGIGLAIASALHQNGAAHVFLLGRRLNVLQDAIKTLQSSPGGQASSTALTAISADVTNQSSISAAVDQITKEAGFVDVLINNAGVIGPLTAPEMRSATNVSELRDALLKNFDGWTATMAINTQSVVGVSAAFLPLLDAANKRRGWASGRVTGPGNPRKQDTSVLAPLGLDPKDDRMAQIITVASVASYSRVPFVGLAYNASKAGAAHLGRILSTLLAEWGIRSNVVCPGPYPSDMTSGYAPIYGTAEVPQGRMGAVEDVAGWLLGLVGRAGAFTNGAVQVTDGGRLGVFPAVH